MTTFSFQPRTSAVCGVVVQVKLLSSSDEMGPRDLDRPASRDVPLDDGDLGPGLPRLRLLRQRPLKGAFLSRGPRPLRSFPGAPRGGPVPDVGRTIPSAGLTSNSESFVLDLDNLRWRKEQP